MTREALQVSYNVAVDVVQNEEQYLRNSQELIERLQQEREAVRVRLDYLLNPRTTRNGERPELFAREMALLRLAEDEVRTIQTQRRELLVLRQGQRDQLLAQLQMEDA
jgi:hypothetical protein